MDGGKLLYDVPRPHSRVIVLAKEACNYVGGVCAQDPCDSWLRICARLLSLSGAPMIGHMINIRGAGQKHTLNTCRRYTGFESTSMEPVHWSHRY